MITFLINYFDLTFQILLLQVIQPWQIEAQLKDDASLFIYFLKVSDNQTLMPSDDKYYIILFIER